MDRRLMWTMVGVGVLLLVLSAELPPRLRLMVLAVYGAGFYSLYWWQTKPPPRPSSPVPPKDFEIPHEAELREIENLTLEQALQQVESRLANSDAWTRVEMPEEAYRRMKPLTPAQQAFFRKHGGLSATYGLARLGAEQIRPFKWPSATLLPFGSESTPRTGAQSQPFTQVGIDFDSNPILAKTGEETVYIVHGTRSSADKWWCANYPSLYHWILIAEIQLRA
jgi:hypothetical protein